jgi:hypothetical protein
MQYGIRVLSSLNGASTARVLNLHQIARESASDPEYRAKPLFACPSLNQAFLFKHRVKADEKYLLDSDRGLTTKIIIPFDTNDLTAGGRAIIVGQRGYLDALRGTAHGHLNVFERDMQVLHLLDAIPSLDPFLVRDHLQNNDVAVASCYLSITRGDQERMHEYVKAQLSRLVSLAAGSEQHSNNALASALLSSKVDEKLEPLRVILDLSGDAFRHGVFCWRGFLYYKWAFGNVAPSVMPILRDIREIAPKGRQSHEQQSFLLGLRKTIIELVRDASGRIAKSLDVYDRAFEDLIAHQSPKSFRDFLLSAPYMFLEIGEQLGAVSHVVGFWRHRFTTATDRLVETEELSAIFQDFISGLGEKADPEKPSIIKQPKVIDAIARG